MDIKLINFIDNINHKFGTKDKLDIIDKIKVLNEEEIIDLFNYKFINIDIIDYILKNTNYKIVNKVINNVIFLDNLKRFIIIKFKSILLNIKLYNPLNTTTLNGKSITYNDLLDEFTNDPNQIDNDFSHTKIIMFYQYILNNKTGSYGLGPNNSSYASTDDESDNEIIYIPKQKVQNKNDDIDNKTKKLNKIKRIMDNISTCIVVINTFLTNNTILDKKIEERLNNLKILLQLIVNQNNLDKIYSNPIELTTFENQLNKYSNSIKKKKIDDKTSKIHPIFKNIYTFHLNELKSAEPFDKLSYYYQYNKKDLNQNTELNKLLTFFPNINSAATTTIVNPSATTTIVNPSALTTTVTPDATTTTVTSAVTPSALTTTVTPDATTTTVTSAVTPDAKTTTVIPVVTPDATTTTVTSAVTPDAKTTTVTPDAKTTTVTPAVTPSALTTTVTPDAKTTTVTPAVTTKNGVLNNSIFKTIDPTIITNTGVPNNSIFKTIDPTIITNTGAPVVDPFSPNEQKKIIDKIKKCIVDINNFKKINLNSIIESRLIILDILLRLIVNQNYLNEIYTTPVELSQFDKELDKYSNLIQNNNMNVETSKLNPIFINIYLTYLKKLKGSKIKDESDYFERHGNETNLSKNNEFYKLLEFYPLLSNITPDTTNTEAPAAIVDPNIKKINTLLVDIKTFLTNNSNLNKNIKEKLNILQILLQLIVNQNYLNVIYSKKEIKIFNNKLDEYSYSIKHDNIDDKTSEIHKIFNNIYFTYLDKLNTSKSKDKIDYYNTHYLENDLTVNKEFDKLLTFFPPLTNIPPNGTPVTGNNNTSTGNNDPSTGNNNTITGNNNPSTGNNNPSTGNNDPSTGNNNTNNVDPFSPNEQKIRINKISTCIEDINIFLKNNTNKNIEEKLNILKILLQLVVNQNNLDKIYQNSADLTLFDTELNNYSYLITNNNIDDKTLNIHPIFDNIYLFYLDQLKSPNSSIDEINYYRIHSMEKTLTVNKELDKLLTFFPPLSTLTNTKVPAVIPKNPNFNIEDSILDNIDENDSDIYQKYDLNCIFNDLAELKVQTKILDILYNKYKIDEFDTNIKVNTYKKEYDWIKQQLISKKQYLILFFKDIFVINLISDFFDCLKFDTIKKLQVPFIIIMLYIIIFNEILLLVPSIFFEDVNDILYNIISIIPLSNNSFTYEIIYKILSIESDMFSQKYNNQYNPFPEFLNAITLIFLNNNVAPKFCQAIYKLWIEYYFGVQKSNEIKEFNAEFYEQYILHLIHNIKQLKSQNKQIQPNNIDPSLDFKNIINNDEIKWFDSRNSLYEIDTETESDQFIKDLINNLLDFDNYLYSNFSLNLNQMYDNIYKSFFYHLTTRKDIDIYIKKLIVSIKFNYDQNYKYLYNYFIEHQNYIEIINFYYEKLKNDKNLKNIRLDIVILIIKIQMIFYYLNLKVPRFDPIIKFILKTISYNNIDLNDPNNINLNDSNSSISDSSDSDDYTNDSNSSMSDSNSSMSDSDDYTQKLIPGTVNTLTFEDCQNILTNNILFYECKDNLNEIALNKLSDLNYFITSEQIIHPLHFSNKFDTIKSINVILSEYLEDYVEDSIYKDIYLENNAIKIKQILNDQSDTEMNEIFKFITLDEREYLNSKNKQNNNIEDIYYKNVIQFYESRLELLKKYDKSTYNYYKINNNSFIKMSGRYTINRYELNIFILLLRTNEENIFNIFISKIINDLLLKHKLVPSDTIKTISDRLIELNDNNLLDEILMEIFDNILLKKL